ncbi:hypothetical protein PMAYCL1PPCAC_08668, partial [Pristionchus mayeri]
HKRSHMENIEECRRFKCDMCTKTFSNPSARYKHKRVHMEDEEKKYPNKCDECDKRYATSRDLKGHKFKHLSEEDRRKAMVRCEECGKMMLPHLLVTHLHTHKGGDFKCGICCKQFATGVYLKK